jgi:two-component system, LytTR family, response regulator
MVLLKVLIVDDEPIARRGIRKQLEYASDIEIVGECANGREAVRAIREQSPGLVFLDVQMPEMDGFSVLQSLKMERMPAVIFVTAYDRYALRAFEVNAVDYLLKPFDAERFQTALHRARIQIQNNDFATRLLGLLETITTRQNCVDRLVIKSSGRIFFLSVEEIDWIEAADNYVRLHVNRDSHLLRETVNGLESKLDPEKFLRIRRSVIVNISRIKELQPLFNGEYSITLTNKTELTSSRRYRKKLSSLLG